jgi:hypothetical protein
VVEDYKNYGEKKKKGPRSVGSSILVISHLAIFIVGISVGYWIGGRFSTSSIKEKNVSQGVEKGKDGFPQSGVERVGREPSEAREEQEAEKTAPAVSSKVDDEPRFTFY